MSKYALSKYTLKAGILSCRLQFMQTLPFAQAHPIEILAGDCGD
ncbi:MAG: hypothetical protein ACLFTC_07405 [Desulfonatronovibrio sp.]